MNEFISVKEKLPEFTLGQSLKGQWVLGRIGGSKTNIRTVRYIATYKKWQNRDRSWCEEEVTHWCYLEEDNEGEYEPEFYGPNEYAFVSRTKLIDGFQTVVCLTLLKLIEISMTNGVCNPGELDESVKVFGMRSIERTIDEIFQDANEEPAKAPAAYLFANGNAAYFDEKGKQIPTLQSQGWIAIHYFINKYPNAPISVQKADPITKDLVKRFLKNIKQIEELPY